ncbi:MAG TPA: folylpolyglutamate synthase/dihydrofolate synthase family protein [Anaerolineaceae bacterium]|jgi:dihydrofolate synthase/folylpolyglutamate synthase
MIDIEMAYQQALDYLYSFVDYSLTRNLRYSAEKFDLGRMEALMERLGNPHRPYPVIHIAGTKGKGSTAAMTASALQAAGYQVGFYSSPHLQEYTERIQINTCQITHLELVELVAELKPYVAVIPRLTTFELTTALAFLFFARRKVDAAVVEVGLGGRLDATNVVTPLVSVITSLSMDHMNILGDTLAQIAFEKAGIIKPGRPVVMAPQKEEAQRVVVRVAGERGSRLVQVGQEYLFAPLSHNLERQTLAVWSIAEQPLVNEYIETAGRNHWQPTRLTIPLLGHHQVENAATAYTTLQVARQEGLKISEAAIVQGFLSVHWPGRFEFISRMPVLVVDSAHNRDSALKLRQAIDDYLPGKPVILIFGASEDKDVEGMFAELLPRVGRVIATQSIHPRAMDANKLVELAHHFGVISQAVVPVELALEKALELAGEEAAVVAAGSLFVAAAVREAWYRNK